jgi:hypothetical protein
MSLILTESISLDRTFKFLSIDKYLKCNIEGVEKGESLGQQRSSPVLWRREWRRETAWGSRGAHLCYGQWSGEGRQSGAAEELTCVMEKGVEERDSLGQQLFPESH